MQISPTLLRIYFIRVGGVFPKTLEMRIKEQLLGRNMTYLERIMKDLKTTIGEKQALGKKRKARKSTRADGTNPRAKGTNPRAKETNPLAKKGTSHG